MSCDHVVGYFCLPGDEYSTLIVESKIGIEGERALDFNKKWLATGLGAPKQRMEVMAINTPIKALVSHLSRFNYCPGCGTSLSHIWALYRL